ncbi:OFA family MFS transporter [Coraliomargarita akajimensis]|uniref:Major facilitator superfamily MFS_1 n=1 Tax=Coraliomargarita akajimensis (strain DSM 45221 / IAM 15411 / JCM 23193 / KCTC 12865 / 04OKA010-24) TaxID=583355 RepID=D5EP36_CORAD|nr:OFA family MFS transporter [Coraliomargarita akajimensis]ADE55546.1 major facilitator superfamily MFS_1 [Coraliomargarita akajimensis DSM 45221]
MATQKFKNRWLIAASAVGVHVSIGSIYAYSAWKMPLENMFGWSPSQTTGAFSLAIFFLGLSAAFLGRFIEKKGPSKGGLLSAAFFCTGLIGAGVACLMESLPLFYLFFGIVSGIGLGVGYISPVSTLVKWFPDRRGLATGLAIMGFGFGGLICARLIDVLVPVQAELEIPKYVQVAGSTEAAAFDKVEFVESYLADPAAAEASIANSPADSETQKVLIYDKKKIAYAFMILGVLYAFVMIPSALYISAPPKEWVDAYMAGKSVAAKAKAQGNELTAKQAIKTFGFYGLWIMLFINVSCGIALISTAKKMGYEMVHLSAAMSTMMVMGISLFNGLGRIFWASTSDFIGRSNTYIAFFLIQILAFPLLAHITGTPALFMAVTFVILTCYGGGFASIPAYISDLFGVKEMPTIHGYILTAWSLAGVCGPMINSFVYQRTQSYEGSLYIFAGAFVIALIVSILMKVEIKRIQRNYSNAEVEAARPHTHDV